MTPLHHVQTILSFFLKVKGNECALSRTSMSSSTQTPPAKVGSLKGSMRLSAQGQSHKESQTLLGFAAPLLKGKQNKTKSL